MDLSLLQDQLIGPKDQRYVSPVQRAGYQSPEPIAWDVIHERRLFVLEGGANRRTHIV